MLSFNPITVHNYASLADGLGVILYDGPYLQIFILVSWEWSFFYCCLAHRGSIDGSLLLKIFSGVDVLKDCLRIFSCQETRCICLVLYALFF